MAAYFGEVREIPSRAVDDDEEVDVELPTVYFDLPEFSDITQLPSYDTVSRFLHCPWECPHQNFSSIPGEPFETNL